jgi:hypothetical protein
MTPSGVDGRGTYLRLKGGGPNLWQYPRKHSSSKFVSVYEAALCAFYCQVCTAAATLDGYFAEDTYRQFHDLSFS